MADPLSVAASIAGLVSLADVVFTRLVKYGKAVKNADKELKELTKDVNLLGGSLDSLSRLARALEDGSFHSNFRMDYIDDCNETLEEMKEKLGKIEADSAKGRLFWPGRSSRLKGWHEDISRHQGMISTALSADTLQALLRILSHEDRQTKEILSEIRDTRSIVSRVDKESRRSKVQAFFLKCNPQENYEMSLQLRHPRTGLWLINRHPKFKHWISAPKSNLWLTGIPGAGKTIIAGSIIEAALGKSTGSIATAFFFCDYKSSITQSPETILGVLAYQLSIQNEDAYEVLVQYYDEMHPKHGLPRTPDISSLKVLLQRIFEVYDQVYLILDGLDECGRKTEDVIDTLIDTFDEANNISLALLSRDADGIRDRLSDWCVSIEVAAHKHDVMEYVTAQIQERIRVGKLSTYDPELKAEIIQGLVDGAKGMFRWVSCQLDHLKDCVSDQDCRDALISLPPTLDETYARILTRVPNGKRRLVELALQFIAYASPKLTIRQLREALSVPRRHTLLEPRHIIHLNAITKYCSSLVRESSDGQYLEFSHFSVQEFLKDPSSQYPDLVGFRISENLSHRLLAAECLRFLQLRNFYRSRFDPKTESDEIEHRQDEFPFYSYAAEHWPSFARHAWDDTHVKDLAKALFNPIKSPYFTSWSIALSNCISDISINQATGLCASPYFTPLHMAAALSLEKICRYLIEQRADVNMKSYIGCPLQCAVQGLLFMAADEDHSSSHLAGILSGYHGALATQDTIKYLCHAGASLDTTFTHIYPGESILEVAFRSTLLTGSLSVPTILVKLGISIREKDVERADRVFQSFNGVSSSQHEERFKASLQPFIESLDQRTDRSAMVLRLCSLAWEAALYAKLEFTFDVMAIDTQVTLSINDLETQAIAATKACNLTVLRKIMSDPRLDAASIADSKGDSLLHLALLEFRDNTKKNLEVARLLINAGCDVLRSNNFGLQPLHCWDWRLTWRKVIWPKEVDSEPFQDLMRMMTKEGAHCNSQDQFGATALHYRINSSYHFQAILDTQPIEEIKAGLEIIDKKGYTPLAYMVKAGALQSFSILVKRVTVTPAMMASPVPILSLAVNADADEVFDFLIPLTCNSDVEPNDSPLHYLGPGASARNTRRLKSLYPDACACRLHGKTPLEAYLESCLKKGAVAEVDPDVMGELSVLDSDKADIADLSKVWERFAQYAVASESEEAVTSAGMSLLKLGYLRVFEKQNGVSGILPMVSSFNDIQTTLDLAPVSTRLLCQILRQTDGNSSLRERPEICRLLGAAARSLDFELANLLFSNGVSVHRRVDGLSVLEAYCKSPPDVPDTPRAKEMFDLLLDHAEKKQLNDCSPGRKGLAAIHLGEEEGAEWMVEKLVQRGADPNLRVRDDMHSNTALVHHLLNFSPNYALSLLTNGADPGVEGLSGWDAALASAENGYVLVLAEILAIDKTKNHPPMEWERTCQKRHYDDNDAFLMTHENYNGLHAGACRGSADVINFYLDNGLMRSIDAKTNNGWTPLHFAACHGNVDSIKALCGHSANVNAQCEAGRSPLHLAAQNSKLASAKALVEAGGRPFADASGCKPSFYADVSVNQSLNEWLHSIETIATDEEPLSGVVGLEETREPMLSTVCATAIRDNHIYKLELLAGKAFDFEAPLSDCRGCSGLIYAIHLGRLDITRWLLHRGAAITQPVHCGEPGRTGLHLALEKVALASIIPNCLRNFVKHGGHLLEQSSGLFDAILAANNVEGLNYFLTYLGKATYEIDRKQQTVSKDAQNLLAAALGKFNDQGITPLINAVRYANLAAVEVLLDFGADVNGTAELSLHTPLHESLDCGNDEVISLLIEKGADLDWRDRDGDTPLLVAASQEKLDNVYVLLGANADRTVLNRYNRSFLDIIPYGDSRSCKLFAESLRTCVSPHKPTRIGFSAFHRAIGQPQFVSYILNSDFRLDDSKPCSWYNAGCSPVWIDTAHRLYRKKYRIEALQTLANMTPSDHWSPLCRFASRGEVNPMKNLLDLNCPLNYEGCPIGSALMVACVDGRMAAVAFLVRRGASLTYQGPNGYRSAYIAARKQKQILNWLLVGRFVDQRKLTGSCGLPNTREDSQPFTWGGPFKAEVVISGEMERRPNESCQAYWSRLMREKVYWRGKVPPLNQNRRTVRPSNLVPDEKVRIHPGGYDSPRQHPSHSIDDLKQDSENGMRPQRIRNNV